VVSGASPIGQSAAGSDIVTLGIDRAAAVALPYAQSHCLGFHDSPVQALPSLQL
jgi:hypothetical protein